jgi:phosphoribosylamine---glycine ligase
MRILIVGNGGRESALACKLSEEGQVYGFMGHLNPSIVSSIRSSGGTFSIGDILSPSQVAQFAESVNIELAFVSSDGPLKAGVVDALKERNIKTVGPDRMSAELEWNKLFARKIVAETMPEYNPKFYIARSPREIALAIADFGEEPVVIKPTALTGGKGVRVVGKNLRSNLHAEEYANLTLKNQTSGVLY